MVEKPLFILKPNISVAIIPMILLGLFTATFLGILAGVFSRSLIAGVIISLIIFILTIFLHFMNLNARRYIFYQKKAEFYEGFLNIVQRTVQYDRITDCVLTKSVWDRMFATGTIRLVTAGHAAAGNYQMMGGGITLQYLNNPDQVYQQIQELINK